MNAVRTRSILKCSHVNNCHFHMRMFFPFQVLLSGSRFGWKLKERFGDAPEVTMFPLASIVLDDRFSTEFKSCWIYLNLLEASDDVKQKTI